MCYKRLSDNKSGDFSVCHRTEVSGREGLGRNMWSLKTQVKKSEKLATLTNKERYSVS